VSLPKIRLERCARLDIGLWRMDVGQARHLVRSLRSYPGAAVEGLLPDGDGSRLFMRLEKYGGEYLLRTVSEEACEPPRVAVTLLIGLLKASQFESVLGAASELGITRVVPILCERSVPRIEPVDMAKKLSRWQKLLDEGTSVSGAIFPTKIEIPAHIEELNWELLPESRYAAVISPDALRISEARATHGAAFAVGPEGDWSDAETSALIGHGFVPVSLGTRIMRASTAAIVGCGWFCLMA